MKQATVDAQFPELKGDCYATGRGTGSTPRAAIARAVADLFQQRNVRRKRISTIKMRISISTVAKVAESAAQAAEADPEPLAA